jgi:hypothetical protein
MRASRRSAVTAWRGSSLDEIRSFYRPPGFVRRVPPSMQAHVGTRDAHTEHVTRTPSEEPRSDPIEPLPTVPIGPRKHVPSSRVQTQVGIGFIPIDHASGAELRDRESGERPVMAFEPQQAAPKREEDSGLFASGHWVHDEPPVVVPLRKTWIAVWTAASLALLPLTIWAMVALASSGPDDAPAGRASSRSDVVPPAPRTGPPPVAPPVAEPPEPPKAEARTDESPRPAAKQRVPRATKERRIEVQRRAPPKGRPTGEWAPRGP